MLFLAHLKRKCYLCSVQINQYQSLMVKYSTLYRALEAQGWQMKRGKRHHHFTHPDSPTFIPVGRHESEEVKKGTLCAICKAAGLDPHTLKPL